MHNGYHDAANTPCSYNDRKDQWGRRVATGHGYFGINGYVGIMGMTRSMCYAQKNSHKKAQYAIVASSGTSSAVSTHLSSARGMLLALHHALRSQPHRSFIVIHLSGRREDSSKTCTLLQVPRQPWLCNACCTASLIMSSGTGPLNQVSEAPLWSGTSARWPPCLVKATLPTSFSWIGRAPASVLATGMSG
jgi:hypothetical protein